MSKLEIRNRSTLADEQYAKFQQWLETGKREPDDKWISVDSLKRILVGKLVSGRTVITVAHNKPIRELLKMLEEAHEK